MTFKHLLGMTLIAGIALAGCSAQTETPKVEENTVATPEESTKIEGTFVSETAVEGSTDVVVTTLTYVDGTPTQVVFDVRTDKGMKRELVASGNYDMGGELTWSEQMDALQAHIVENQFDLSKVVLTDEAGHTDAISGVSITVGSYLPILEALMTSVQEGSVSPQ